MTQRYSPSIVENPATCTIYAGMDPDPKGLFVRYEFEAAQARDIWYARAMALETENDRLSAKVSELIDANDELALDLEAMLKHFPSFDRDDEHRRQRGAFTLRELAATGLTKVLAQRDYAEALLIEVLLQVAEADLKLDRIREALREHDCVAFGEELMAAFDEAFGEKWSL